uniref:Seipin n=1 Tax=Stegastes partitus TaxID=144197 RepID=A0A3B4ZUP0_9TELE
LIGLYTDRENVEPSVLIGQALLRFQDAVAMAIARARQRVVQGFIVFSIVFLLLWLAAFLYGSFYYSYMPKAAFSAPVHYYYRCVSSFLCSYPLANISLMRNRKHVLTFGQAYQISLRLEVPDSPTNQDLGMFMIKTTCFSQEGGQVASSARSSMLRYRSDLLRTLGTLLFLPAFLTGAAEQRQVLDVELFSDYTDDPYAPSVTAVIEILSNKVQIYSSQLYVHAHFTGIRYLLFYFPVLSALVGVSSNFVFLSILFILSYSLGTENAECAIVCLTAETNHLTGTTELLGPCQISPTDLSPEEPHLPFGNGTELQNGNKLGQGEKKESEAASGHY